MSERSKLQKALKRRTLQLEKLQKEMDELNEVDFQLRVLDRELVPARGFALKLLMKESRRLGRRIARQKVAIEKLTGQEFEVFQAEQRSE